MWTEKIWKYSQLLKWLDCQTKNFNYYKGEEVPSKEIMQER